MIKQKEMKKGFSLVELMIVIAIMVILATVGFFAFTGAQKSALASKKRSELKEIAKVVQLFATEKNSGSYIFGDGVTAVPAGAPNTTTPASANTQLNAILSAAGYSNVPTVPAAEQVTAGNSPDYYYISTAVTNFGLCVTLNTGGMFKVSSANLGGADVADAACTAN